MNIVVRAFGELALEHRAFARDHAVLPAHFAKQEWRINIRQEHLACVAEIAAAPIQILRHHAEREIFFAQHAPHLPQHLLDPNVGTRVARAVIARKEQLQFFSRLPGTPRAKLPERAGKLDQRARPCLQEQDPSWMGSSRARPRRPLRLPRGQTRRARAIPVGIGEMAIAAESQQRIAILRKRFRGAAHFRDDARIVEHRVPNQVWHENFQQRCAAAESLRDNPTASSRRKKTGVRAPAKTTAPFFRRPARARASAGRTFPSPVPEER